MILSDFHFLRPFWLLALTIPAIAWLFRSHWRGPESIWRNVVDPALLPHVLVGDSVQSAAHRGTRWAAWFAYLLGVFALAGPAWQRLPEPVYQGSSALIIMLDLSRSMDAQDVRPSRLTRARFKIADILAHRKTGLTALVVYAAGAYGVVPLTDDVGTITNQLPVLETNLMPAQGSSPRTAVSKALEFLEQSGLTRGDLLLVTDSLTESDASDIGALLADRSIRLSILALGTPEGAPIPVSGGGFVKDNNTDKPVIVGLDITHMQATAAATGGLFMTATRDDSDVTALNGLLARGAGLASARSTTLTTQRWQEEGPWLLLPLLPVAALLFRRGILIALLLMLLPLPRPAMAFTWEDLWRRADQQGAAAMARNDPETAADRFHDHRWQAIARYRSGNFPGAVESLQAPRTSDDHYNRGNALAKMGRFQDAIAAYEQALTLDANNEDARHNRDLLMQLQQQSVNQGGGDPNQQSPNDKSSQSSKSSGGKPRESKEGPQDATDNSQSSRGNEDPSSSAAKEARAEADKKLDRLLGERRPEQPGNDTRSARNKNMNRNEGGEQTAPPPPEPTARDREESQADEQWLRRIPDDPGGLLRRKFFYQYSQSDRTPPSDTPW